VGDLGTFLFEQNLVSRMNMRPTQPPQRIPPGFSDIPQASTTRLLQKPIVQQSPTSSLVEFKNSIKKMNLYCI